MIVSEMGLAWRRKNWSRDTTSKGSMKGVTISAWRKTGLHLLTKKEKNEKKHTNEENLREVVIAANRRRK